MNNMGSFKENSLVDELIERLLIEFNRQDKSGIYGFTQYIMAYNSNKIEGSKLSEKHTANLFNTMALYSDDSIYLSKDVEEAQGHFLMFNHFIKSSKEDLSENLILKFHYELKSGVFEDRINGYAIGDYKTRPNVIGGNHTTSPKEVKSSINSLLLEYNNRTNKTIRDIAEFHCNFEAIHPFQDGNGRVGRIIVFRECIKNNLIPVLVRDDNKKKYYEGLINSRLGNLNTIIELFEEEQKWYKEKVEYFLGY